MRRITFLLLALFAALSLPAQQVDKQLLKRAKKGDALAQYQLGVNLIVREDAARDVTQGIEWLQKSAAQGLDSAQVEMASFYLIGFGVPLSPAEGIRLMIEAAEQGHLKAQHALGEVYASDEDGTPDYATAAHWYRRAAEQGDEDAMYVLGTFYELGRGVKASDSLALQWYKRAADAGSAPALYELGVREALSDTATRDEDAVFRYFMQAAEQGYPPALNQLGETLCAEGEAGNAESAKKAILFFQKAANAGEPKAIYNLGRCYHLGRGVEKDVQKGLGLMTQAALQYDQLDAERALGLIYGNGDGVEKNFRNAAKWLEMAVEHDDTISMHLLVDLYVSSTSPVYDATRGFQLMKRMEQLGDKQVLGMLGVFYFSGEGVRKDKSLGLQYLERYYQETGSTRHLCALGMAYVYQDGVEKDVKKGEEYLLIAAEGGDVAAQKFLANQYHWGYELAKDYVKAFKWYTRLHESGNVEGTLGLLMLYRDGLGVKRDVRKARELAKEVAERGDERGLKLVEGVSE